MNSVLFGSWIGLVLALGVVAGHWFARVEEEERRAASLRVDFTSRFNPSGIYQTEEPGAVHIVCNGNRVQSVKRVAYSAGLGLIVVVGCPLVDDVDAGQELCGDRLCVHDNDAGTVEDAGGSSLPSCDATNVGQLWMGVYDTCACVEWPSGFGWLSLDTGKVCGDDVEDVDDAGAAEDAGQLDRCAERQAMWCADDCIGTVPLYPECDELHCECEP